VSSAQKICALIDSISEIMQHQGVQHFEIAAKNRYFRTLELCGLTLTISANRVLELRARDIEIVLDLMMSPAINDNKISNTHRQDHYSFLKGSVHELENWHTRLVTLQSKTFVKNCSQVANDTGGKR
jgi:hypothetical protein